MGSSGEGVDSKQSLCRASQTMKTLDFISQTEVAELWFQDDSDMISSVSIETSFLLEGGKGNSGSNKLSKMQCWPLDRGITVGKVDNWRESKETDGCDLASTDGENI